MAGQEWSLGCVNSHPAARGSQEVWFTQPRDHSFAQPCIGICQSQTNNDRSSMAKLCVSERECHSWGCQPPHRHVQTDGHYRVPDRGSTSECDQVRFMAGHPSLSCSFSPHPSHCWRYLWMSNTPCNGVWWVSHCILCRKNVQQKNGENHLRDNLSKYAFLSVGKGPKTEPLSELNYKLWNQ